MGWDTPEVSPLIYLFIADKKKKKTMQSVITG